MIRGAVGDAHIWRTLEILHYAANSRDVADLWLLGELRCMAGGVGDVGAGAVASEVNALNDLAIGKITILKFITQE